MNTIWLLTAILTTSHAYGSIEKIERTFPSQVDCLKHEGTIHKVAVKLNLKVSSSCTEVPKQKYE